MAVADILFPSASFSNNNAALASGSKVAVTYKAREKETIVLICPINLGVPDNEQVNLAETKSSDAEETGSDFKTSGVEAAAELRETIYEEVPGSEDNADEPTFNIKLKEPVQQLTARNVNENRSNSSSARAVVQWFKDSERLVRSARFSPEGPYLKISNVNLKDAGRFECRLVNDLGNKSANLTLEVSGISPSDFKNVEPGPSSLGKPVFLNQDKMRQRRFNKRKGSSLKLRCKARGYPKPDVLWSKDDKPLSEEDYGITRSKWTIELSDLRIEDSGNYTCQVFNKHGSINYTYELNVFGKF